MIRVVYCEDEGDFSALVSTYLDRLNSEIELTLVTTATEALEEFCPETYDCVLCDYDLPGRDGLALLRILREDYPDFPFVLYTGRGSEEIAGEAIRSGVTDYLQKDSTKGHFQLLENRIVNAVEGYRAKLNREKLATRFELVEKASPDAFWDRDIVKDTVVLGLGFEQLFGYEPGLREDSYTWWYERVHSDDREQVVAEIQQVVAETEHFYEGELRFEAADGTFTDIVGRGYIIYEDSVPVREVGIVIDRTRPERRDSSP